MGLLDWLFGKGGSKEGNEGPNLVTTTSVDRPDGGQHVTAHVDGAHTSWNESPTGDTSNLHTTIHERDGKSKRVVEPDK